MGLWGFPTTTASVTLCERSGKLQLRKEEQSASQALRWGSAP